MATTKLTYDEASFGSFVGLDEEIDKALDTNQKSFHRTNIRMVNGPAGSGKSSFLQRACAVAQQKGNFSLAITFNIWTRDNEADLKDAKGNPVQLTTSISLVVRLLWRFLAVEGDYRKDPLRDRER